jgi:predicted DCC family thiol-disulfide oxidoreductase YuxK
MFVFEISWMPESQMKEMSGSILLYDGVCGFCNWAVRLILKHDREGVFRFASLQSELAKRVLAKHRADASRLDTLYVVLDSHAQPGTLAGQEALLSRSDAVLFVLNELGGPWRVLGRILRVLPPVVSDWGYRTFARYRYSIFGRYDSCPLPSATTRSRFLDL